MTRNVAADARLALLKLTARRFATFCALLTPPKEFTVADIGPATGLNVGLRELTFTTIWVGEPAVNVPVYVVDAESTSVTVLALAVSKSEPIMSKLTMPPETPVTTVS